jgi:RNA polymerase sigma factor (sigma-70 family)
VIQGESDSSIRLWLATRRAEDDARLRAYVRARTNGDRQAADEVVQHMYKKFLDGSIRPDGIPPSERFLFGVLRNLCRNYGRWSRQRQHDELDSHQDRPVLVDSDPAVIVERQDSFFYALEGLSDREREALCLSYSLSNAEIAQVMGLPTSRAAACAVYRARRKARARMHDVERQR